MKLVKLQTAKMSQYLLLNEVLVLSSHITMASISFSLC